MIVYVSTEPNLDAIRAYLDGWGKDLRGQVEPMSYAALLSRERLPRAVYIFTAWGRVPAPMAARLARRRGQLAAELPPGALLNDPGSSMRRYELLRTLHQAGVNRFDVMRVAEPRRPTRFPVFVRDEGGTLAQGQVPRLFNTAAELQAGLHGAANAGADLRRRIIVERLDTADAAGIHRKYGAFFIAGRVLPRHLFFSRTWVVKVADLLDEKLLEEERHFIAANPYAEQIRKIFSIAHIDYGRIDFWVDGDGLMQVFEINTNPMIVTDAFTAPARAAQAGAFAQAYNAALLDHAGCLGL